MFLRIIKTPYTLSKYILKNPKYNIPKVSFAGWVGYKIFQFAHADASAIETVKNRVLEVARKGAQTDIEDDSQTYHLTPMKQVLVILNPASSGGDAGKYFEQYIEPILMVSGFDITVYKTTGVKDARDHAKSLIPEKFETIIVVGGDGTLSEVLSGIQLRPDAAEFMQNTKLAVVPAGKLNNFYRQNTVNQTEKNFYESWRSEVAELACDETARIIDSINSAKPMITSHPMYKVQIRLENETWEEARMNHVAVYGTDELEWGLRKNWIHRRNEYWSIVPFKKFRARFEEKNSGLKQEVELDLQIEKCEEMVSKVHQIGKLGMTKTEVNFEEVKSVDKTVNHKSDHFQIKFREIDEFVGKRNDQMELWAWDVNGKAFDFGMNEDVLGEVYGNRFRFHRAVLRNLTGSEWIYIDGSEFPLDGVAELEITHVGDKINYLQ